MQGIPQVEVTQNFKTEASLQGAENVKATPNAKMLGALPKVPMRLDQLDQMDLLIDDPKEEATDTSFKITPIPIDPDAFNEAYDEMMASGKIQRPSVLAALRSKRFSFDENKWIHIVQNEHEKDLLEEMRDLLVNTFRKALNNPSLQFVVNIDPNVQPHYSEQVLTDEEKLQLLQEKNPHFSAFLQKFTAVPN